MEDFHADYFENACDCVDFIPWAEIGISNIWSSINTRGWGKINLEFLKWIGVCIIQERIEILYNLNVLGC
jgi:hypothetical protein